MYASFKLHKLTPADVPLLRALNALFGEAFGEPEAYGAEPPSDVYLEALLAKEHVIALVAFVGQEVVGGLVAYELDKFERTRSELYIYDLAVGEAHRRQGIATALIKRLREIAAQRGACRSQCDRSRRRNRARDCDHQRELRLRGTPHRR